jgi:hypothetical protein
MFQFSSNSVLCKFAHSIASPNTREDKLPLSTVHENAADYGHQKGAIGFTTVSQVGD